MRFITLTRGQKAMVDDADYEWLSRYKWCAQPAKTGRTFYALRSGRKPENRKHTFPMHRQILGLTKEDSREVDHIDGNGLNNQRDNLRICTHTENVRNRRAQLGQRFKGVTPMKRQNKTGMVFFYCARLGQAPLGCYPTAEQAARAYDEAAKREWGEFVKLNFP